MINGESVVWWWPIGPCPKIFVVYSDYGMTLGSFGNRGAGLELDN